MARAKTQPKHDAHVQLAILVAAKADEVVADREMGLMVPPVELPANVSLAEALAESGESVEDLKEEAAVPAKVASTYIRPTASTTYEIGEKAQVIRDGLTRQRSVLGTGKDWAKNGKLAPNTRHIVIEALAELAGEDGTFTYAEATKLLATMQESVLGSGTPSSYIRAFVKCEYLVVVA